jgi:hypothetical protein
MKQIKKVADTIYVRIDPKDRGWLKKYVRDHPELSEKAVVAGLIKYFKSLPPGERNDILRDPESVRSRIGAVIELMGWGDHAFSEGNWEWALEAYSALLRRHSEDAPGMKRFVYYKRGFCWLDVAIRLREEALRAIVLAPGNVVPDELWHDHYQAADQAIDMSIHNNEQFERLGGKHPMVHYSIACGWALRAKYAVERALPRNDDPLIELAGAVEKNSNVTPRDRSPDKEVWMKKIAESWRKKVATSECKRLEADVERFARKAMEALDDILREGVTELPQETSEAFVPHVDIGYFVRYAEDDSDLLFLKYDITTSTDYHNWVKRGSRDRSRSWLETFRRLQKGRGQEIDDR